MAISDLVRHQTEQSSLTHSQVTDKPPSLARFEFVIKKIAENSIKGPDASPHHRSMMHIIEMIFDEAVEELVDAKVSEDMMSQWIFWFGKLFEWCATGDTEDLPVDMQEIVGEIKA